MNEEFKKMFENMNEAEQKNYIFKYFLDKNNLNNKDNELDKYFIESDYSIFKYLAIKSEAILLSDLSESNKEDREKYQDRFNVQYNAILEKWIKIAKELKITDSVQLSNLFSYLLWNGYFSKDKTYSYKIEDRNCFYGLFSLDIMNGIGVCLNNSDMLKDFLIKADIDASIIVNNISNNNLIIDKDAIKIADRKKVNPKLSTTFASYLFNPISQRFGNHACTLIYENNELYIYDPTNFLYAKIDDYQSASFVNASGQIKLNPYLSYTLANFPKEKETLEKLLEGSYCDFSMTKEQLNEILKENLSLFDSSISLFDDCYTETRSNIISISNNLEECRKELKAKNRIKTKVKK